MPLVYRDNLFALFVRNLHKVKVLCLCLYGPADLSLRSWNRPTSRPLKS